MVPDYQRNFLMSPLMLLLMSIILKDVANISATLESLLYCSPDRKSCLQHACLMFCCFNYFAPPPNITTNFIADVGLFLTSCRLQVNCLTLQSNLCAHLRTYICFTQCFSLSQRPCASSRAATLYIETDPSK